MKELLDQVTQLRQLDAGVSQLRLRDVKVDLGAPAVSAGGDVMTEVGRMAAAAKERQRHASLAVRLETFDMDVGFVSSTIGMSMSPGAKLLHEAKERISQGKYQEALVPLRGIPADARERPEGLYLTALCWLRLGRPMQAMQVFKDLNPETMVARLATRTRALKAEIRDALQPVVVTETTAMLAARQYDKAAAALEGLIELDPDPSVYYYLLAGVRVQSGNSEAALHVVNQGLDRPPLPDDPERERLAALKAKLEQSVRDRVLGPARALYKKKRYKEARAELNKASPDARKIALWQVFDRYLAQITDGGGIMRALTGVRLEKIPLQGPAADLDALFEYIVEPELRDGKEQLKGNLHALAEPFFAAAVEHVPQYGHANFLYAFCIYKRVAAELELGGQSNLDSLVKRLQQARTHVEVALRDNRNTEARSLATEIDASMEVLRAAQIRAKEVALVNGAIQELLKIALWVQQATPSPMTAARLVQMLVQYRGHLRQIQKQVHLEDTRAMVELLITLIDTVFAAIGKR